MSRPELLLVDDNEDDVRIALRAMRRAGIAERVKVLEGGAQALDYIENLAPAEVPRAIFLDLRMPGVSGWEVLRMMRARTGLQRVPIIIVSSTHSEEEIAMCYRLGANSFVSKNYESKPVGEFYCQAAEYWLGLNEVG